MKFIELNNLKKNELKYLTEKIENKSLIPKKIALLLNAALLSGFDILQYGLLVGSQDLNEDLNNIALNISNYFSSNLIELKSINKIIQISKDECITSLFNKKIETPIQIRTFDPPSLTGIAFINENGKTLIQVIKGGFYGFWLWETHPSSFVLTKEGKVQNMELHKTKIFYDFNLTKKKWEKKSIQEENYVNLSDDKLLKLFTAITKLNSLYPGIILEWYIFDNAIKIFDIVYKLGHHILEV